jgi:hypothetical protein
MVKTSVNRHFAMPNNDYSDQDQFLLMMRDPENKQHAQAVRDRLAAKKEG